jgi:SH3-like domain-containing protein
MNWIRYIPHNMKPCLFLIAFVFVILLSSATLAERLAVSGPVAYIRSGPGTKYGILWKAGRYYPLLILEKSGKWLHFSNYEGDKGWINRSLVDNIPTVITKSKRCNIRGGPGTVYKILATIGKGLPFRIIKREGSWLNIQHADGFIGWIHKSLVW